MEPWPSTGVGVLRLPSGRLVRGRGLSTAVDQPPQFGLYLTRRPLAGLPWPSRWVRWPDLWLPTYPEDARSALQELWRRAATTRVEVACGAGVGRTGTALACLAVLDGVPPSEAVSYVRRHYRPGAVETPWQRRYVVNF